MYSRRWLQTPSVKLFLLPVMVEHAQSDFENHFYMKKATVSEPEVDSRGPEQCMVPCWLGLHGGEPLPASPLLWHGLLLLQYL